MIDRIKEARLLFLKKGILKRESLRNEIAFSWARSQVYSVDPESLDLEKNSKVKKLILDKTVLENYPMIEAIIIINSSGIVSKAYQASEHSLYKDINFSEMSIGTNGIALANSTNKNAYVSSYEHYHQLFFDKLTYAIPFNLSEEKKIVGIILNQNTEDFLKMQMNFDSIADEIIGNLSDSKEITPPLTVEKIEELYVGQSEKMIAFKNSIRDLKNRNNNIFILGKKGSGKETVARIIHQESARKTQKFYSLYCDKIPTNIIVDEVFTQMKESLEVDDENSFGTVYCESFETLSFKAQEVLTRLLESKPVNSNASKVASSNGYRFVFSSEKSLDEIRSEGEVNEKLLNRINVFTIKIPTLQDVRDDLPSLVLSKIEKYTKQYFLDPIIFDETLLVELVRYKWPENYRELDKIIEQIVYKGRFEKVIDSSYLPIKISRKRDLDIELQSLEKTEHNEIMKALEVKNHNIALTAKVLGIGRSTLYRKLDKYKIKY